MVHTVPLSLVWRLPRWHIQGWNIDNTIWHLKPWLAMDQEWGTSTYSNPGTFQTLRSKFILLNMLDCGNICTEVEWVSMTLNTWLCSIEKFASCAEASFLPGTCYWPICVEQRVCSCWLRNSVDTCLLYPRVGDLLFLYNCVPTSYINLMWIIQVFLVYCSS